jgi:hypothetical protein
LEGRSGFYDIFPGSLLNIQDIWQIAETASYGKSLNHANPHEVETTKRACQPAQAHLSEM